MKYGNLDPNPIRLQLLSSDYGSNYYQRAQFNN